MDEWVNISEVVRASIHELKDQQYKHGIQVAELVGVVEANKREVARLESKLEDMEHRLALKGDAAYFTDCLLTKANKSDTIKKKKQESRDDLKPRLLALEMSIKAIQQEVGENKIWFLAQCRQLEQSQKTETPDPFENDKKSKDRLVEEEKSVRKSNSREFHGLVKQVEALAAVQSEINYTLDRYKEKLEAKANKESVANAIHRKANKDAVELLLNRIRKLENK